MKYVKPISMFQELLKLHGQNRGRLLGLDVGDKYVGLAVSDVNNKIASPLSVLPRKKTNIDLMASDFQLLISELSLAGFIVGCPSDRQRNPLNAMEVKLFIDELCETEAVEVKLFMDELCETGKLEGLRYTFWNERFISENVKMWLKPYNLHPVQYKTLIGKFSAAGILQGYLDFANKSESLKLLGKTSQE